MTGHCETGLTETDMVLIPGPALILLTEVLRGELECLHDRADLACLLMGELPL